MTKAIVRTHADAPTVGADVLLDLFDTDQADATVRVGASFFTRAGKTIPTSNELLLALAASVYVLDKSVAREGTETRWTRTFELGVPRHDEHAPAPEALSELLTFLTGDVWTVTEIGEYHSWTSPVPDFSRYDDVCLFSGGLDSFCGAVQLLEAGRRILLVGHHDGGVTSNPQSTLAAALEGLYPDQLSLHQINVAVHADENRGTHTAENSHRSRSLLFIATGLALAATISDQTALHVPENGPISLNIPLTAARRGTASTRTTHPHFLELLRGMLVAMGINNPIITPFNLLTKGELVAKTLHSPALLDLAHETVSCSRIDDYRYITDPRRIAKWDISDPSALNCGYCFPCLIRRASLHHVGQDDPADYRVDVGTASQVRDVDSDTSSDLRAVLSALRRGEHAHEVFLSGPIPDSTAGHADVYLRGRQELRTWLTDILPAGTL